MLLFIEKLFLCLSNLKISLLEQVFVGCTLLLDNVHCCAFSYDIVEDEKLLESPEGFEGRKLSMARKISFKSDQIEDIS
jgi:hypothetical protein